MTAMADDRAFVLYDWMAGYGVEPTLECPSDAAFERRLVAESDRSCCDAAEYGRAKVGGSAARSRARHDLPD
jgi:hypothetical protein